MSEQYVQYVCLGLAPQGLHSSFVVQYALKDRMNKDKDPKSLISHNKYGFVLVCYCLARARSSNMNQKISI